MKKFLKIALLAMSAVMLLCVSVGAEMAFETSEATIYSGGSHNSVQLTVNDKPDGVTLEWNSSDPTKATVDDSGVVTGVANGPCKITAYYIDGTTGQPVSCVANITVDEYKLTSVKVENNHSYVVNQTIDKNDFTVTGTYSDNTTGTISNFDFSPKTITSTSTEVTVTVANYSGPFDPSNKITLRAAEIDPEDLVKSIAVYSPESTTEFKVGDKLNASDVEIAVTDIYEKVSYKKVDGNDVKWTLSNSTSYTFSSGDVGTKTFTVSYAGKTATGSVKVSATAPTAKSYTVTMTTKPTKTTYTVGDTFDSTGMKVTIKDEKGTSVAATGLTITPASYKFTDSDVGKTSIKLSLSFNADGASYEKEFTVSGLTIKAAATELEFYSITDVELAEEKYPIGYKFSTSDITRIYYKEKRTSTKTSYIKGSELSNYSNDFDLQVLDEDGDEKSSKYAHILEEDDVTTSSSGKQTATLALFIDDDNEYEFTVSVGDSGFAFYYDGDLIKTYDDLEDALDATIEQDKDVDTDDFDLDDVKDSKYILIKLGEDYKISSRYDDFDPEHNVVIDLNGHDLTFYTDTVAISSKNDDYTVIIKNSSKTAAKFLYDDKTNGEITLAQNETLTFEYDEDLPGFYTLTIKAGTNGSILVKGNTKTVTSLEVAHGSDITLTVTPDKGYQIDTVKYDGKTLSTTNQTIPYTVSKDGVATVTLKGIAKSAALEATFKKAAEEKKEETKKAWVNPFTDVKSTDKYYSAVEFVCDNELFNGVSATKFAPENTMTRAMFVTVLGRLAAKTQNIDFTQYKTSSFPDVSASNPQNGYAAPYIEWASRMGIVEGYEDGTFKPNNNITHQQMYLMMQRYASFIEHKYTDASQTTLTASDASKVADWALNGVKYAQNAKIMVSTSKVDPAGNALRWELATVLMLFCQNVLNGSIK